MGNFIIQPSKKEHARVYDNTFLWNENNIYVMANHRLALWCWLQCENVFERKHALIHIDAHTDAREWSGPGESECLDQSLEIFETLKDFKTYEGLQCPYNGPIGDRSTRPCITYDNFVHLAAQARIFDHYYIYASIGTWRTSLADTSYTHHKKIDDVYKVAEDIKKYSGKCIVDVDLDFFDDNGEVLFPDGVSEDELLIHVFTIISEHRKHISMITISLNESPGDELWEKRQHQLSIVKRILGMQVPIPIM